MAKSSSRQSFYGCCSSSSHRNRTFGNETGSLFLLQELLARKESSRPKLMVSGEGDPKIGWLLGVAFCDGTSLLFILSGDCFAVIPLSRA